jgi:hypothetical protein
MRVTGYSERGAINALFYEIAYSNRPTELLQEFLALARFPTAESIGAGLIDARVLIEQSLSDFGDADAVLLLDAAKSKTAVFLEAKVKSSQAEKWTLQSEFREFEQGQHTERQLNSSNLFTQLYNKARFVAGLKSGGVAALEAGLEFPLCSTRAVRKIGSNPVVLKAAGVIEPYCQQVWYLALVPDTMSNVDIFFKQFAAAPPPSGFIGWDALRWGGLSWEAVSKFCTSAGMTNTGEVLKFNAGQIC